MYGHDASRTGYNAAETALTASSVARLAQKFQVTVGMATSPSSSGPVVSDGKVCVGSSLKEGDNYFCFDAANGGAVWRADLGHFDDPNKIAVGIGSTAAIADGTLVVGGGDAAYYALDAATGGIRWRSPMDAGTTGIGNNAFAWSSPVLAGGVAYVGIAAEWTAARGELRALRLSDGGIAARQYFVPDGQRGGDIWNSPSLSPDGGVIAVATGNDFGGYDGPYTRALITLDPANLSIVDTHQVALPNEDLDFSTTPVFFSDAAGRSLVGANHKNGTFFAFEVGRLSAGPIWQRSTGSLVGAMPAYDPHTGPGGTLFVVGDNGLLFALDPATGADRWPPVAVGHATANIALANGLVFMGAGSGRVAVLDAATGALLRILVPAATGPTYSGIALAQGMVYWMSGPYLNAWGLP